MRIPKSIRLAHEAYAETESIFHVVFHAMPDTTPFRAPNVGSLVWGLLTNERERGAIELIAACLMPDHLHVVASPRGRDLIRWANGFKSYSTRVAWTAGSRTAVWQPSFYDRRLRDERELESAVDYVVRNPAVAGLIRDGEVWPWVASWLGEPGA